MRHLRVDAEVVVPFRYLSNFWRSLDLTLINHEIELYVPVVTLSIDDNIKFSENIKQGFNRTISSNKYRSEINNKTKK